MVPFYLIENFFIENSSKQFLKENQYDNGRSSSSDHNLLQEPVKIKSYTMSNLNRMEVIIITWGATIVSLKCPDKFGTPADVVIGFDNVQSEYFKFIFT